MIKHWYTERRKQLRDESRLELFFRMGAALTLSLGAGTGLQLEDTRHRLGGASLHHPLVSLSTTRERVWELCPGMVLYKLYNNVR